MCTARPGWQMMSFRIPKYKTTHFNVKVNLVDVLDIDVHRQVNICTVTPRLETF